MIVLFAAMMMTSSLGLQRIEAAEGIELENDILSHGPPAGEVDSAYIEHVPNSKWGRTYWETQAPVDIAEIRTTRHQKNPGGACKVSSK
jgi:hypothetical protein